MLQNPSGPANIFSVAFPESKIPSWFTKRSLEPLISIEVNPNGYKSNWKGIALCVCFRPDPSNQMVGLDNLPVLESRLRWCPDSGESTSNSFYILDNICASRISVE